MKELTFITSHAKKAEELARYLNFPVTHHKLDLIEIQSLDPSEVVTAKAEEAYRALNRPVLVEDFSIKFEALGGLPGPLIKWFLKEMQVEGLCQLLNSYGSRHATARTCFALRDEDGLHVFDGAIEGTITKEPRGGHGYGTDSIFIPDGSTLTWGEMDETDQATYSLRRIGLEKLEAYLNKYYRSDNS